MQGKALSRIREPVVRVPAGGDTGTRSRVRGEGEAGVHGGPPGDLYVVLTVEQDKRWQRQGQNLIYSQEISFVQAALGHKVEVPGIDGPLPLEVPKGVQSGTLLRLAGEGLPYPGRRERGDLLVEVRVLTPTRLSSKQEELLREFEQAGEQTPLEKVKKAAKKISKAMGLIRFSPQSACCSCLFPVAALQKEIDLADVQCGSLLPQSGLRIATAIFSDRLSCT